MAATGLTELLAGGPGVGPWRAHAAGGLVELRYRGNLFCAAPLDPDAMDPGQWDGLVAAVRRLRDGGDYTPRLASYLYHSDPWLHQLAHLLAGLAREQRHVLHWPYDDAVYLRGDAVGSILYHLARGAPGREPRRESGHGRRGGQPDKPVAGGPCVTDPPDDDRTKTSQTSSRAAVGAGKTRFYASGSFAAPHPEPTPLPGPEEAR